MVLGGFVRSFFIGGVDSTFREFTQKPWRLLTSLTDRYEVYEVCESFLQQNEELFRELGQEISFSPAEEEINISNGEKTMTVVLKAQGKTETREVIFQLKKEKKKWRVLYVGLERRNGQYRTLYSR